jgi:mRNA-degrading endonuclease RelE of RelBE toxin-antitoxin system
VTGRRYTIAVTRSVRRALAETLPLDGVHSARLMREWRVLYVIDDDKRIVTVRAVVHRRDAYRSR